MSQDFEQFGKYILLEKLAAGGMAEVFLAKSPGANGVNKFVAIKRILPQYSDNDEFIDMFKEEAKIAINLNQGNVVPIYEFGIEKKQFYLVMEYVEGRNLRQIINELKKKSLQFSIEQIVFMVKEVAAGLDHAHRCIDGATGKPLNITHRDMSPQNVMVSFEGEVKVIDFGIAKAETQMEATKAGTLKGKFGYMSPEQADGQPIDMRTDIFSLGIVLWELLANDRLFTSNSEAAILRKIRECQIPSIRKINLSVPPELERIVNKALAKDKSLRYQTAAALHKDLNRFLNTEYPDFSPHDFSVFIKNAFTEIYQSSRQKLMTYANVKGEESTAVTQTMTYTDLRNENSMVTGLHPTPFMPPEPAEKLDLDPQTSGKINLTDLKKGPGTRPSLSQTGIHQPQTFGSWQQQTRTNQRIPQGTAVRRQAQQDSAMKWGGTILFMMVIGFAGWTVMTGSYKKFLSPAIDAPVGPPVPPQVQTQPVQQPQQATANPQVGQADLASTSALHLTINSEPMGARIYINNEFRNAYTPTQMTFKKDEHVLLRLEKGDMDYEGTVVIDRDAMTVKPTLIRRLYGRLSVNIINGGAKPQIELIINGTTKSDLDPQMLHDIRVPAKVPIVIKAMNPFAGVWSQKTIMVEENQRQTVDLVLSSK